MTPHTQRVLVQTDLWPTCDTFLVARHAEISRSLKEWRMPEARRKSRVHSTAGRPWNAGSPFQITYMDISGPYPLTTRRNKYILTFIDHFTKFVETLAIPDNQRRHAPEFTLPRLWQNMAQVPNSDQGAAFMSFFSETFSARSSKVTYV